MSWDLLLDSLVKINPCFMTLVPSDKTVPSASVYVGVEIGIEPMVKPMWIEGLRGKAK
jgi:hypothetical protein